MDKPFEHIEFPDGQWWDIWTVVTRGMRKRFRNAAMGAMLTGTLHFNGGSDLSDPEKLKAAILANPGSFNLNAIDDGYLLHGTKAWSWPEPVSLDVIDTLPDDMVSKVLARMAILYAEVSEEIQKKDIGTSSRPT